MRRAEKARRRAVANAILTAPALGAFAAATRVLGLDGAVQLCETRDPPPEVRRLWWSLGHRVEQLPSAEDIRCLLVGIEVHRRYETKRRQGRPTAGVIEEVGCTTDEAREGFRLMEVYGCRPIIERADLGAI